MADPNGATAPATVASTTPATLTVRELAQQLIQCSDLDAEVAMTLFNSDPVSVTTLEETDGQVVLQNAS